ncbi:protein jim lovell isoform X4 [Procambarus clarkii]|uniref:protein jim lovell isoform X4 n=1 Tax=Procambarus clarkii TaxID=6728 RepID=UPI001E671CC2|nr:longitudinals lacking protein, isoforms A/B/D/L-like isoform X4 [Procambarus clarkii]
MAAALLERYTTSIVYLVSPLSSSLSLALNLFLVLKSVRIDVGSMSARKILAGQSIMEEGILSLRWNNHRSTFFHVLSTLHRKELYSDVTLACDGKFFPVHKMVLSVCSEYFEEMFKQTNCKHPIIVLKDILHDDLEALLNYMYAGEANVVQSDLARLIKAAECLRIKGLAVPDEAPQLSDSKRPHTDGHRDETYHPKRRKHDDHSISPSKSNQGHTRERRNSDDRDSCKDTNDTDSVSDHQTAGHRGPNAALQHHHSSSPNSNLEMDLGRSSREENTCTVSQDLAEVVLEEHTIIKEEVPEPKHEQEDEITQLTDSEASISYDPINSVDERGVSGVGIYNPQMMSSHPQNVLQDIMVQGVPGPSGMPGDSLAPWESMAGFSLEGLPSDESRSTQAMGRDEGGSGASGGARRYCGPVGVSAVRNVEGSTGGLSCPYCGKVLPYHSEYQRHLRKHTGERPFACPHCAYATTRKSHLKTHMQKLHSNLITSLDTWTIPLQES